MSDVKQLKIEEYNLVDFVMKIQQGIRDGYEVTDQSDDAPLQIGGGFYTIMREKAGGEVVDEKLSTEEFTELANKAADLIDKVDNLLVEAEAKHIEATTPVKATPKQTRGKK